MSSNSKLRRKFCKTMDINLIPGKVIFINKLKILFNTKTLQKQVINTNFKILLNLLKKQPDTSKFILIFKSKMIVFYGTFILITKIVSFKFNTFIKIKIISICKSIQILNNASQGFACLKWTYNSKFPTLIFHQ